MLVRHHYSKILYIVVYCKCLKICVNLSADRINSIIYPASADAVVTTAPSLSAGGLGALSTAMALLLSPVTISVCRRRSTRLTAVLGGLVTALGCLFTSFASQYHQLFFSYGTVIGTRLTLLHYVMCYALTLPNYFF